jgi:ribonucleoside-triphosphate reductase
MAKEYLSGITYMMVDAEENSELTARYGVMQAPTLVVVAGDEFEKYINVSNIKSYVEQAS